MIIKINTIASGHAKAAINYALQKSGQTEKMLAGQLVKETVLPDYIDSHNLEVHPLTGEPTSAVDVCNQMRLQQAMSTHHLKNGDYFRMELRPPVEECRNWTLEQWEQFNRDCEAAIASVDKVLVVNKKTHKMEWKAVRPLDFSKAQVLTTRHTDKDPHLHKIVNRHTIDGGALSSHYINLIGIHAANIIAEKYGWTRADQRENKQKIAINKDAIEVLKGMKTFDIDRYFALMKMKGWILEPKYDNKGNAVRYRIGYLPKGSDRPVMWGASQLGKGRHLMVSQLLNTWEGYHPEERRHEKPSEQQSAKTSTKPVMPHKTPEQLEQERLYRELKAIKDRVDRENAERAARQKNTKREPTKSEVERQKAINKALNAIRELVSSPFRSGFSLWNIEDVLPEAIAAKAINDSQHQSDWRSMEGLQNAAESMSLMVEMSAEKASMVMEGMMAAIGDMVFPPVTPSGAGAGGGESDLPKKKDDDWERWKKNGFTNKQRKGLKR